MREIANKIKGLTIEIGGNTVGLNKALADVNKSTRDLKSELRDVERLLKLDPKNTELLSQKQKILAESVDNTKKKLDTLKEAEKQAQEQFKQGKIGEDQYRAIQREVIKAEQDLKKLENQLKDVNNKWKDAAAGLDNFGKKTTEAGKGLTKNVTAPILAAGAASVVAFKEVDNALDTIVTKTGATGEAMEGFEESFRKLSKNMPVEMQKVGDAIGEVNTQFGLTGEVLEKASEQMIKFSEINGQDVTSSTINAKEAIEAYELGVKDLDLVLNSVTKTAQNTGVSTDKIFDSVIRGAPQIKALGLDFAQATEMMGRFEQKGLDGTKALSYMARAQVQFAKDGKTLEEGLEELTKRIANSTSETEQLTLASEYFGTKGASFMLDAIKRGALDFEDLANAAKNTEGAVTDTFEGTLDPIDKFSTAMNNVKLMGSDIATTLQEVFAPALEKMVEKLQVATDWFANLSPEMQEMIIKVALVAAAIGPLLIIIGKMATGISAIMSAASTLGPALGSLGTAIGGLSAPILIIIGVIAALVGAFVYLWKTNEDFRDKITVLWEGIKEFMAIIFDAIKEVVSVVLGAIKDFWEEHGEKVMEIVNKAMEFIGLIFETVLGLIYESIKTFVVLATAFWDLFGEDIKRITSVAWETIKGIISGALDVISGIFDVFIGLFIGDWERMKKGAIEIFKGLWKIIESIVRGAWNLLKGAFDSLWDNIQGWFTSLKDAAFNWGKNMIQGFIDGIKSMASAVTDAVSNVVGGVKDFLGFGSPTKKGEGRHIVEWGENMISGFIDGMEKAMPELHLAASKLIPNISGSSSVTNTNNANVSLSFYPQNMTETELENIFVYCNRRFGLSI